MQYYLLFFLFYSYFSFSEDSSDLKKNAYLMSKEIEQDSIKMRKLREKYQNILKAISIGTQNITQLNADIQLLNIQEKEYVGKLEALTLEKNEELDFLKTLYYQSFQFRDVSLFELLMQKEKRNDIGTLISFNRYLSYQRSLRLSKIQDLETKILGYQTTYFDNLDELNALKLKEESLNKQRKSDLAKLNDLIGVISERLGAGNFKLESILSAIEKDQQKAKIILAQQEKIKLQKKEKKKQQNRSFYENVSFKALKGKMNWPVLSGSILSKFGSKRIGNLKWKGLVIGVDSGTEVKAVSDGRVVYADFLNGFGLLIAVEHGSGYVSLYGYNQSILKNIDDPIKAGEVISFTGVDFDGREALYFELRYKGSVLDPLKWFVKSS